MSDPIAADGIADAFAAARPALYENVLVDTYELLAETEVEDEFGGRTVTDVVVESPTVGADFPYRGRCKLATAPRLGTEGGTIVVAAGPYTADLPIGTVASETHRIRINGREFAIVSPPKQAGGFAMFTQLDLQERSR